MTLGSITRASLSTRCFLTTPTSISVAMILTSLWSAERPATVAPPAEAREIGLVEIVVPAATQAVARRAALRISDPHLTSKLSVDGLCR